MTFLVVIIALALIFDYINGFHDAANSIATIVSTKVLTPFQAVVWAAVFNFLAFFIFKDHGVANTIAKTVHEEFITLPVIFSGLLAAIAWNLFTWWFGIPSSSSHTLIGGFAGAAIAHAGFGSVNSEKVMEIASFIVLAPMVGMLMAFIISLWFINSFRKGPAPKIISLVVIGLVAFVFVLQPGNRSCQTENPLRKPCAESDFSWLQFQMDFAGVHFDSNGCVYFLPEHIECCPRQPMV
jgi:Phosphate/sulphate permeases